MTQGIQGSHQGDTGLSHLISECTARGWLVNNLFQVNPDLWQANLRNEHKHTGWGQGPTPELALNLAMDLIEEAMETVKKEPTHSIESSPATSEVLNSIMANLRPKPTIQFKVRL